MMREESPEETDIDLGDSECSEDLEDRQGVEAPWETPTREQSEEDITSTLVDISDTKPLLHGRDPRGINDCLKVTFEDVIAEPASVRSGDRVWIWSNALFEVTRVWIYRTVTVLLAVPVSILSGLLFSVLSCLHIWMVSPCMRCVFMGTSGCLHTLWSTVLDLAVRPVLTSAGRCCGGLQVHLARE